MAATFEPAGACTALVTPFDARFRLDLDAYRRIIEFQVASGIRGLVPVGSTGESPTLSWDEHILTLEAAVKAAQGKAGVLAGTGSNSTEEAISATRHAREAGAGAALLVDCYYNGPSSLELRSEYYEAILEAVPEIPLVPYLIPGRTGCVLSAEDLAILHRTHPRRVPAVKEATGDLERMRCDRTLAGPTLAILSGDDDLTVAMMQDPRIQASGVISVMSNLAPGAVHRLVAAQSACDRSESAHWAQVLAPLFRLVTCRSRAVRQVGGGKVSVEDRYRNPVPVKTMMAGLGIPCGPCRRPLGKMERAGVETCRAALREVFRADPESLRPIDRFFGVNVEGRLADDSVWAALTRS